MQYRLLVSIEVVEFMERLPLKTREALRRGIHEIGRDPLGAIHWAGPMRRSTTRPGDECRSRCSVIMR